MKDKGKVLLSCLKLCWGLFSVVIKPKLIPHLRKRKINWESAGVNSIFM